MSLSCPGLEPRIGPGLEDIEVNHEAQRGTRKVDTLRVWVVLEEGREQSD